MPRTLFSFAGLLAALALSPLAANAVPPLVSAGGDTTCAAVNGAAFCWGYNIDGQVGNGTASAALVSTPTQVQGLTAGVQAIVTSGGHSCAIVGGGAFCWGNNAYGQLGNGSGTRSPVPVAVSGLGSGVSAIAVGDIHSCAVHNGAVKCWGHGDLGKLGTGNNSSSSVPVQVAGLTSNALDVTTGRNNGCAIVSGAAFCWGQGDSGEMGNGASNYVNLAPVAVTGYGTGVSVLSGGNSFVCGIQNAAAKCWGWGNNGRLGGGTNNVNVPQQVTGLTSGVTAISAANVNGNHACAVANGGAQCWGANNAGQLGNPGATGGSNSPVPVQGLTSGMIDVSGGGLHTCATTDTQVYCWGDNTRGQLGTGNQNPSGVPVLILTVPPPPANPARLVNISTRGQVLTGNDVMIGGFIIGGSTSKTVVVRARGPSLIPFGIPNALADPTLDLYSGQTVIATNDDWQTQNPNAAAIQAAGLNPSDPNESAIYATLNPGAYTAVVSGFQGGTGVGIVEVFEVDQPAVPLINISTRGQVLTNNDVMIGGFIIQGDAPQTVVIRARGPSLVPFGIPNALMDPVLQLFSGQTPIASNDNWQVQAVPADVTAIQASGFAPTDAREAVIRVTLQPGAYTAIVTGKNGTTGVGIVEVFAQ